MIRFLGLLGIIAALIGIMANPLGDLTLPGRSFVLGLILFVAPSFSSRSKTSPQGNYSGVLLAMESLKQASPEKTVSAPTQASSPGTVAVVRSVENWVVGESFYKRALGSLFKGLKVDELDVIVTFEREPNNQHDPKAIKASIDGKQVGHLSAKISAVVSPILDQAKVGQRNFVLRGRARRFKDREGKRGYTVTVRNEPGEGVSPEVLKQLQRFKGQS